MRKRNFLLWKPRKGSAPAGPHPRLRVNPQTPIFYHQWRNKLVKNKIIKYEKNLCGLFPHTPSCGSTPRIPC